MTYDIRPADAFELITHEPPRVRAANSYDLNTPAVYHVTDMAVDFLGPDMVLVDQTGRPVAVVTRSVRNEPKRRADPVTFTVWARTRAGHEHVTVEAGHVVSVAKTRRDGVVAA